jgi:hypothetical protein
MIMAINRYNFQRLWNRVWKIFTDKSAELKLGEDMPEAKRSEIKIGKTLYIVNSHYSGEKNIVQKLEEIILEDFKSNKVDEAGCNK